MRGPSHVIRVIGVFRAQHVSIPYGDGCVLWEPLGDGVLLDVFNVSGIFDDFH